MVDSMWTPGYTRLVEAVVDMRRRAGLTQRQLAEELGREQSFVGRIETGQRRVDLVEFLWIAKCCGLDPEREVTDLARQLVKAKRPKTRASVAALKRLDHPNFGLRMAEHNRVSCRQKLGFRSIEIENDPRCSATTGRSGSAHPTQQQDGLSNFVSVNSVR